MFVSSTHRRNNPRFYFYNDKEVPTGNFSERELIHSYECVDNPKGTSAYKNFSIMSTGKNFVNNSEYANISTRRSAKTTQSNRTQIGFKPQNHQNSRGKIHKVTPLIEEPILKATNQYAEIVSKAFFEFLQDEVKHSSTYADNQFKDKVNAARLLFPNERKNLKNYLKTL